jgi:hypothetical protein
MSSTTGTQNFFALRRSGTTESLRFGINIAGISVFNQSNIPFPQNTWGVVAVRYRRVDGIGYVGVYRNDEILNLGPGINIGATTFDNRTDTMTYLGRATYTTSLYFNGSMRFAAMWDRALSDAELTGLYTSLTT